MFDFSIWLAAGNLLSALVKIVTFLPEREKRCWSQTFIFNVTEPVEEELKSTVDVSVRG